MLTLLFFFFPNTLQVSFNKVELVMLSQKKTIGSYNSGSETAGYCRIILSPLICLSLSMEWLLEEKKN